MSITAKLVLAYFGGIVTGVLSLLGWMTVCMGGSRQEKTNTDLMLSEMDGKDEGNGRLDESTSVTLFMYIQEYGHFIDWDFKNRTDMEKHIARDMENAGRLSCEISYRKRDDGLHNVLVDGKYFGTADLRNDRTMNK